MNMRTKYGFDLSVISGSYGGTDDIRHMTYNVRRTTPWVWPKRHRADMLAS